MASKVRVEFISLDTKFVLVPSFALVPSAVSAVILEPTGTPTAEESRVGIPPIGNGVNPYFNGEPEFARITAITGNTIVASGEDLDATEDNGLLIMQGDTILLFMQKGHKLSFIEYSAS